MTIALELLEAYVKCPTRCWLISKREPISDNGHAQWVQARNEAYLASGVQRLLSETPHAECIISPSADKLKTGKWGLEAVEATPLSGSRAGPTAAGTIPDCSMATTDMLQGNDRHLHSGHNLLNRLMCV
jgi:hypothetical protein